MPQTFSPEEFIAHCRPLEITEEDRALARRALGL